jgi:hypothetical protein
MGKPESVAIVAYWSCFFFSQAAFDAPIAAPKLLGRDSEGTRVLWCCSGWREKNALNAVNHWTGSTAFRTPRGSIFRVPMNGLSPPVEVGRCARPPARGRISQLQTLVVCYCELASAACRCAASSAAAASSCCLTRASVRSASLACSPCELPLAAAKDRSFTDAARRKRQRSHDHQKCPFHIATPLIRFC